MVLENDYPNELAYYYENDLMYEEDHEQIAKLAEAYSDGRPKAAVAFKDILSRESFSEPTTNLPCPVCGYKGVVLARSTCDDGMNGFWCEACGHERNIQEDLLPMIDSILYYTIVATPLNVVIARLLYNLFTEQINKMNLEVGEQEREQEEYDKHLSAGPYSESIL